MYYPFDCVLPLDCVPGAIAVDQQGEHAVDHSGAHTVDQPGTHTAQEVFELDLIDVIQQLHTPPSQATTSSTLTPPTPNSTVPLLQPQEWIADRTGSKTRKK